MTKECSYCDQKAHQNLVVYNVIKAIKMNK